MYKTTEELEEILLDLSGRSELNDDEVQLFQEAQEELERREI